ncbi:rho GTPase-activating protein 11A-like [Acipenser oxyrinchus oxyrinchus]|uniref:Rho GTPase-activating protein 11A-like n=1 Tax=Acipenser oxyrinchus oxyrinchus TaxID=40147 RepID=A0AAD8G2C0_ACIOX|nr:rho GTPase-activating protein 11A-like [Acipenser oxyrinchus oxyrinchus]
MKKLSDKNVMRLAIVQQLRGFGIKIKNWNKDKTASSSKLTGCSGGKIFGTSLQALPQQNLADYGTVPCFLVDACENLTQHIDTEGLFRKSGSVVRLKALKVKLDQGEDCISSAPPCDVAGLLKQFFRELPEPVIPTDLHEAFFKAQQLPTEEEQSTATVLLSCMLPERTTNALRYFFNFLKNVSQRSAENKMDSTNLAVIFAPNLLQSSDGNEKMTSNTEKRLKLQAAAVRSFIENAQHFGCVPDFIMSKIPAMLGVDAGGSTPSLESSEDGESELSEGVKRRRRRSVGDMVNGALHKFKSNRTPTSTPLPDGSVTPVILTPSSKRKLLTDSAQSLGFSSKKRRSLKHNLALEFLPNKLFGSGSTPASSQLNDTSPSISLESSHGTLTPSARSGRLAASSAKRKSKRFESKKVNRVESGKAGCFSPRVNRKEVVRKSLRLRLSLGKSSRDSNVLSNAFPTAKGSENIGWRLATQETNISFGLSKEATFSPVVRRNTFTRKGSKYISKSEENLLTPQSDESAHRTSWNGTSHEESQDLNSETPMGRYLNNFSSEPALVARKPPVIASVPRSLCPGYRTESPHSNASFAEDENNLSESTLLKIKRGFTESGSGLRSLIGDSSSSMDNFLKERNNFVKEEDTNEPLLSSRNSSDVKETCLGTSPQKQMVHQQIEDLSFVQRNIVTSSPGKTNANANVCHVEEPQSPQKPVDQVPFKLNGTNDSDTVAYEVESIKDSCPLEALCDLNSHSAVNVTTEANQSQHHVSKLVVQLQKIIEPPVCEALEYIQPTESARTPEQSPHAGRSAECSPMLISHTSEYKFRVADHIQKFNVLSLHSPKPNNVKSPLKFKRTPVRQSVRRINSLLGVRRPVGGNNSPSKIGSPMVKSMSHESGLSLFAEKSLPNFEEPAHCIHVSEDKCGDKGPCQNTSTNCTVTSLKPQIYKVTTRFHHQTRHSALGDVTNQVAPKANNPIVNENRVFTGDAQVKPDKSVLLEMAEKEKRRYRGSPKNPLPANKLLSATKPIDL